VRWRHDGASGPESDASGARSNRGYPVVSDVKYVDDATGDVSLVVVLSVASSDDETWRVYSKTSTR
jgi:hypothetical protein